MTPHPPALVGLAVRLARMPWRITHKVLAAHPSFAFEAETRDTQTPATIAHWLQQQVLRVNPGAYWPTHHSSVVTNPRNILIGVETSPGLMPGCYVQGIGTISIGDYTQIAANVGIISANHSLEDNRAHRPSHVEIGAYGWIGMGATILPGVVLGDFTVVGAGAVVTRSFPEGHCVVAGNPARLVKKLDPQACVRHRSAHEYHGYIRREDFAAFRARYLAV